MPRSIAALAAAAAGVLMAVSGCEDNTPVQTARTAPEAGAGETALVQDRFVVTDSGRDHAGTRTALLEALDRRDLTIFAVIDHQAGARSVDLELPPMTLVIFGNPRAGTPLMQAQPLLGAELPLRALIFDEDGVTRIAVTGTDFLRREYGLEEQKALTGRIADTLGTIVKEATTP